MSDLENSSTGGWNQKEAFDKEWVNFEVQCSWGEACLPLEGEYQKHSAYKKF